MLRKQPQALLKGSILQPEPGNFCTGLPQVLHERFVGYRCFGCRSTVFGSPAGRGRDPILNDLVSYSGLDASTDGKQPVFSRDGIHSSLERILLVEVLRIGDGEAKCMT
ncbi:hypothetical protein DOO78_20930 [Roseicella frigidaeris]|uniref:Uncharacterized protein n=1 Tax=Roseicella frigidaeris TaxID=2230885 RepID=A0A327M479_9PROT|nr:hypothetical protein DOO78_20930 [Roseicella frigidaeris]